MKSKITVNEELKRVGNLSNARKEDKPARGWSTEKGS